MYMYAYTYTYIYIYMHTHISVYIYMPMYNIDIFLSKNCVPNSVYNIVNRNNVGPGMMFFIERRIQLFLPGFWSSRTMRILGTLALWVITYDFKN